MAIRKAGGAHEELEPMFSGGGPGVPLPRRDFRASPSWPEQGDQAPHQCCTRHGRHRTARRDSKESGLNRPIGARAPRLQQGMSPIGGEYESGRARFRKSAHGGQGYPCPPTRGSSDKPVVSSSGKAELMPLISSLLAQRTSPCEHSEPRDMKAFSLTIREIPFLMALLSPPPQAVALS